MIMLMAVPSALALRYICLAGRMPLRSLPQLRHFCCAAKASGSGTKTVARICLTRLGTALIWIQGLFSKKSDKSGVNLGQPSRTNA